MLYMETLLLHPPRYTAFVMPKASKLKLMPLPPSDETPGQRLARIRRERGKLRLNADMILRFATALEISTDALLQPDGPVESRKSSRKVLRRLEQIEALPPAQQTALLRTIDTFLEGAAARAARRA